MQEKRVLPLHERDILEWFFSSDNFKELLFYTLTFTWWNLTDTVDSLKKIIFLEDIKLFSIIPDEKVIIIQDQLLILLDLHIDSREEGEEFSVEDFHSFINYVYYCIEMQYILILMNDLLSTYFTQDKIQPYLDLHYIIKEILCYDDQTYQYLLGLIPNDIIASPTIDDYDADNIIQLLQRAGLIYITGQLAVTDSGHAVVSNLAADWEVRGLWIEKEWPMTMMSIGDIFFKVKFQSDIHLLGDNEWGTNDIEYSISPLLPRIIPLFLRLFISKRQERDDKKDLWDDYAVA